jgi:choline-sulfatase
VARLSCLLLVFFAVSTAAAPPNVLLLSVDTLRADHLGCYGYDRPTSPALDAFAATAILFEDAVCEVPLTSPSMGSMLSSRHPRMNGTTRNGLPMPANVPLVQETFQQNGYFTFCITSNWTLKRKLSGLDRGFDHYDDAFKEKRWGIIKPERSGDEVTKLALQALADRPQGKPFFAWVHYSDPHAPYKLHDNHQPAGKNAGSRGSKQESVKARYDSEIAFTDAEISRLLAALPENTAVLFVGDHGESLYEHGYLGHGRRIYQNNLHIPLMIRANGIPPARSAFPARGIDVGPTLLGLAALTRPEGMLGIDLLRDTLPESRARVVETYGGAVPSLPGAKAVMGDAGPMLQGVLSGSWKLIVEGKRAELYNLADDPGELKDLAAENPAQVEQLRTSIDTWNQAVTPRQESTHTLTEEDVDALKSLGYVE